MYEQFGFSQSATGEQSLTLFVPDNTVDPTQYARGGPCRIVDVRVIGDFQRRINPSAANWDTATGLLMDRVQNAKGYLFTYRFATPLPEGYYQYHMDLRLQHKGLRSPNFYPDDYDWNWHNFSPDGYGIDEQRQVIIYHRWGNAEDGREERFMVVLNFSDAAQYVDIPFSTNGQWTDLLNGNVVVTTQDYHLHNYPVPSNWGCVFWQK